MLLRNGSWHAEVHGLKMSSGRSVAGRTDRKPTGRFGYEAPNGIRRDFPLPGNGIKCQDWFWKVNLKPF